MESAAELHHASPGQRSHQARPPPPQPLHRPRDPAQGQAGPPRHHLLQVRAQAGRRDGRGLCQELRPAAGRCRGDGRDGHSDDDRVHVRVCCPAVVGEC